MFEVGKEYNRRTEIHGVYGGQSQSGISTPSKFPFIFIFISESGEKHGYKDGFVDGVFLYTGEGQVGDMAMIRGNKAIFEHVKNNKKIYVFEQTRKAFVRYVGSAECLDYFEQKGFDREGNLRKLIVFQLDIDSTMSHRYSIRKPAYREVSDSKSKKKKSLAELRKLALAVPTGESKKVKERIAHQRADAIKKYVLARANGVCEGCEKPAPFMTKKGPYLECHHLYRLADGGPDHPESVITLCPNCHREAHYSKNLITFNKELSKRVLEIEFKKNI